MKGMRPAGLSRRAGRRARAVLLGQERDRRRAHGRDRGRARRDGLADPHHQSHAAAIAEPLRDKHHFRKHGPTAYYGQR